MYYKLNEDKSISPCTGEEWADQFEKENRHVADEEFMGKRISTVWSGLDHDYSNIGPPLLFETMVFDKSGNDIYCKRHSFWEDAELGHERAKQWVKDGCGNYD
jgi:hypothetical protein